MMPENEKLPRTIRVVTLITIFMSVVLLVGVIRLTTWALQSSEVLVINNEPVPVVPPEVKDGDKVFLNINYCIKQTAVGHTTLNLIGANGSKIAINWPSGKNEKGCNILQDIPITIPGQTPTDKYYAEFTVCYDLNPLKKNKCTTFKSREFKVVNSKLNPGDAKVSP